MTCCLGGTRSHPSVDVELSPLHLHRPGFSSYAPRKLWVQQAGCTVLRVLNPASTVSMENTARILRVTEWRGNMTTTPSPGGPGGKQIFPNKKMIDHEHYSVWFNFLGSVDSDKSKINFFKCPETPIVRSQELSPYLPLDTNENPA